jgi:hypothetical protein
MSKIKSDFISVVLGIALMGSVGCGRNYVGSYTGSETANIPNMNATSGQVNLAINSETNNTINGTWNGTLGTGTFTGVPMGDQISNVSLMLTSSYPAGSMGSVGSVGTYPVGTFGNLNGNYGAVSCGPYAGTLVVSGSFQVTGTLASTQVSMNGVGSLYGNMMACPSTRTINLTKQQ